MQTSLNIKTKQDTYDLVDRIVQSTKFAKKAPNDYNWLAQMAERRANARPITDKQYAVTFGILRRQAQTLVEFGFVKPSDDTVSVSEVSEEGIPEQLEAQDDDLPF